MPTWLDRERRPPCKRNHAGANPVVGPVCPDVVADCIGLSEGPGPGSIPGRDIEVMPCGCGGCMAAFEAVGQSTKQAKTRRFPNRFDPGATLRLEND